jgi:site-specific DNA-methyltransferase (adenine-specific)/adenine-specific DNA-methyltransferase
MATLNWIGKEAVVNHHREVPYRLLKGDPKLSVGPDGGVGSGNLLVQGDNLEALKALLPYYGGKVKCIYIDPPYNTGNEGWLYSDSVNSPEMKAWLGKAVGAEGADLSRHDKWACMMYPRLQLLKQFLTDNGMVLVSIGDDEFAALRYLLDEVFSPANRVAIFSWKSRAKPVNVGEAKVKPQQVAEYIMVYAKNAAEVKFHAITSGVARTYPNRTDDGRAYRLQTILKSNRGESERETMRFPIAGFTPSPEERWQGGKDFIEDLYESGYLEFRDGTPFRRYFEDEEPDENDPLYAFLPPEWTGTAETGKAELNSVLGNRHGFDTVKPTLLMKRLLRSATRGDDIVMDSFAGSGTTGHAVLAMNKADGGNRRCILVEIDKTIAETITAQRLTKVIEGYHPGGDTKKPKVEGLGGGFRYVTLGPTLFDEFGHIRSDVRFADLAAHVFFTETGEPIPKTANGKKTPFIGACKGTAYYLLFNGILGDKRPDGGNVLTGDVLAELPTHDGPRVVFGEACRLGAARLAREGVTFKQIPYEVKGRPSA